MRRLPCGLVSVRTYGTELLTRPDTPLPREGLFPYSLCPPRFRAVIGFL